MTVITGVGIDCFDSVRISFSLRFNGEVVDVVVDVEYIVVKSTGFHPSSDTLSNNLGDGELEILCCLIRCLILLSNIGWVTKLPVSNRVEGWPY